mmetsp:Transcript_8883/g.19409  ORF Transcript_8883/g.19409 Transcript_8883/m.19409 type:complete len:208 (+) Transcript_8883:249-872(+)
MIPTPPQPTSPALQLAYSTAMHVPPSTVHNPCLYSSAFIALAFAFILACVAGSLFSFSTSCAALPMASLNCALSVMRAISALKDGSAIIARTSAAVSGSFSISIASASNLGSAAVFASSARPNWASVCSLLPLFTCPSTFAAFSGSLYIFLALWTAFANWGSLLMRSISLRNAGSFIISCTSFIVSGSRMASIASRIISGSWAVFLS